MLMKKTKFIIVTLVTLSLLFIAACGNNNNTSSNNIEKSTNVNDTEASAVTIQFANAQSGDVAADWDNVRFPEFKSETGIGVENLFINFADMISQLLLLNTSGNMPDAGMVSAFVHGSLASRGMLVNLTEFIEENDPGYDLSRLIPNLVDAYRYEGDMYGLPSDLDLGVLWYNKELFDEANIAYPDGTWTWDDYQKAAISLTKGSGIEKQYGTMFPDFPQVLMWQNGADVISKDGTEMTIDTPEAIEAISFMSDLVNKHEVAPRPGSSEQDLFQAGKVAMHHGVGPWYAYYGLKDVDFEWGIAPLPQGAVKATTAYGGTFVIFEDSKNKKEAWEFLKWFLSDEQQLIRAEKFSWFPPASTTVELPEFSNENILRMNEEQKKMILEETNNGRAPIVIEKQNELNQIINRELSLVWAGEKSPEDAAAVIKEDGDALLK